MNLRILALILTVTASFIPSAKAQLLNFDFSFSGVGAVTVNGTGTDLFSGTISGEVIGLQDNASSMPSNIIITSVPGQFGLAVPFSFAPFTVGPTEFTVTGGQITAITTFPPVMVDSTGAYELIFGYASAPNQATLIELEKSTGAAFSGLQDSPFDGVELATGGLLSALHFTLEAAPEPSSWILWSLSLLVIWYLRVRRTRA